MTKTQKRSIVIMLIATLLLVLLFVALTQIIVAQAQQVPEDDAQAVADFSSYFGGGSGSDVDPYLIYNDKQLKNIQLTALEDPYTQSMRINRSFRLMNDIVLTDTWTPIQGGFTGTFYGNNKSIYNLKFSITNTSSEDYYGLFRHTLSGSRIENLNLVNVKIDYPAQKDSATRIMVGSIVGYNEGTIYNCKSSGFIDALYLYNGWLGGIVGYNYNSSIEGCVNAVDITGSGFIGGITAFNMGTNAKVTNCTNAGTISYRYREQDGCAAGIVGKNSAGTIVSCYNYGKIIYVDPWTLLAIRPCMAQIVGSFVSGTLGGKTSNLCYGSCDYSKLHGNQLTYCSETISGYPNSDKN